MYLNAQMISDHLSSLHEGFEEFQCLKCDKGSNSIHDIRMHMAAAHPASFLFVGARHTIKPVNDTNPCDGIQVIYVGSAQIPSVQLVKCSASSALNSMDPLELNAAEQRKTLNRLNAQCQNVKIKFSGKIPDVMDIDTVASAGIISYKSYDALKLLSIQYQCCTDGNVNRADPICCNINGAIHDMISMLKHRCSAHSDQPMVFVQIEQHSKFHVHKIVRCEFQCQICATQFSTRWKCIEHFHVAHLDCWVAARILVNARVVQSSGDHSQSILAESESLEYIYCSNLRCIQPDCSINVVTRSQAIQHYNEHHNDIDQIAAFEVALNENIIHKPQDIAAYKRELDQPHQMHLFVCLHCNKLFESLMKIEQHFAEVRGMAIGEPDLCFNVKKLLRCRHDKSIRTLGSMERHNKAKHPNDHCLPVHPLSPKSCCGICNSKYTKTIGLRAHYDAKHPIVGECYTDDILGSIHRSQIDQCKYTLRCCASNQQQHQQLHQIVEHTLKCHRRFACIPNSTNRKFFDIISCVKHCMRGNVDLAQIINDLQCFQTFLSLLQQMEITAQNGFVMKMHQIAGTEFGNALNAEIHRFVREVWHHEKDDLRQIMMVWWTDAQAQSFYFSNTISLSFSFLCKKNSHICTSTKQAPCKRNDN